MGNIRDIIELAKDLESRAKDRKDIDTLREIISLTQSIQTSNAQIVEKNLGLLSENHQLKIALEDLKKTHAQEMAQLQEKHRLDIVRITGNKTKPKDDLEPQTLEILKFFFRYGRDLGNRNIATEFRVAESVADYHIDELLKKRFIVQTRMGMSGYHGESPPEFRIDTEGRAYIVKNGLVR